LGDDEDDEGAWAVDTFDAAELDVRRGRRPGDERDRPALAGDELAEARNRFRDQLDDLLGFDDTDVQIGDERDRASAFARPAGQRDRPGLGNGHGAAGDVAVECVELACRETVVLDELELGGTPRLRESPRYDEPLRSVLAAGVRDGVRDTSRGDP